MHEAKTQRYSELIPLVKREMVKVGVTRPSCGIIVTSHLYVCYGQSCAVILFFVVTLNFKCSTLHRTRIAHIDDSAYLIKDRLQYQYKEHTY